MKSALPNNLLDPDLASLLDSIDLDDSIFQPAADRSSVEGEKYIVFHLDEKLYAVHSEQVTEVFGSLPVTKLPLVPDWLAGIANVRGEIITVIDLRRLWQKKTAAAAAPEKNKLIVLHSARENQSAAFIVDKLDELISLTPNEIEFSAADFESSFPTFFGRANYRSQTIFLLDAESLFSSLSAEAFLTT